MLRILTIWIILQCFTQEIHTSSSIGEVDCASKGKLVGLKLDGCDAQPCKLQQGKSYQISVTFIPSDPSSTLALDVSTKLFGFWSLPILKNGNGCAGLVGSGCPYTGGSQLEYKQSFTVDVPSTVLGSTRSVSFKLEDDRRKAQVCFTIDVFVTK